MYNLSRTVSETIAVPLLLAAAVLYSAPAGAGPTASDLDCVECVEAQELETGAVGPRELAVDAVYATTVLVRADGTPGENCTALLDALIDTTIATATDPYLIKLEPGIYDCPFPETVEMNPYVDIEGSGQNTTIIRGYRAPVVKVAANSELRQVTVDAAGGPGAVLGVDMPATNSRLANVTVIAEVDEPGGIPFGVSIGPGGPQRQPIEVDLDHVTVKAGVSGTPNPLFPSNGTALHIGGSSLVHMTDVRGYGANTGMALISTNSANVVATGSLFQGVVYSFRVEPTNTAVIVSSQLIGPLGPGAGVARCIASYDVFYNDLLPDCTP